LDTGVFKHKLNEAVEFLRGSVTSQPKIGIILGSGLGIVADTLEEKQIFSYSEISGFPSSTAPGHKGELIFGKLGKNEVMLMNGRFHLYEGYSPEIVTFPIRVMQLLGVQYLFITNAAGGLNPDFDVGIPMIIKDHINMTGFNPLVGENTDEWGPRFPDMSDAYSSELRDLSIEVARELGERVYEGVYVAVTGPNFETPAELRMLRHYGADAVGMSTVPEVITAVHGGIKVFGISAITDRAVGEDLKPLTAEEVLEIAEKTGSSIARILISMSERL